MPLLKRTQFTLPEPPSDLEPDELVFQVRFTKEIFQDYHEYLKRINLYRHRVWTCKVTGKTNLTYEEALLSEQRATEKVQQFPEELIGPALRIVQYSMLPLRDLVSMIRTRLQDHLVEGVELYGRKDGCVYPCKIIQILDEEDGKPRYEVAWLNKLNGNSIVSGEDLIRKKLPFTGSVLKSFIRESTYRNVPWVIHDNLASKYGISTDPPEELKSKIRFLNGCIVSYRKRKENEAAEEEKFQKRNRVEGGKSDSLILVNAANGGNWKKDPIKYPIDDLLVQPSADDPVLTDRPSPSRDFSVPMDCVGNLLMVWNFCSSFGRLLHLWPFSLENFGKAVCHKDSNVILVVETHATLLYLLINDGGEYYNVFQKKKRKPKITLITWTEYLCDFLEMINIPELSSNIATIKRGHYGLLDAHIKLSILRQLVNHALATDLVRVKLDEYIEQRQAIAANKREEALEDGRKKKEAKERLKAESEANGVLPDMSDPVGNNLHLAENFIQNGNVAVKNSYQQKHSLENGDSKHHGSELRKLTKQLMKDIEKNKEHRREYLEQEMEKRYIRTNSLGKDRDYNRYWFFQRDGRVFVESSDFKEWGYYSSMAELDALMGSLNPKGERERALKKQLKKHYQKICLELQKRNRGTAQKYAMEESEVRRSSRVRAPPRANPALAFLNYVNKWKED
ncbi:hypothetical protein Nepgr_012096 [Nepenthes gracilis]|uniref:DDT domain-containing protein n=1 Tax=Nepenthes gracilis TaxID=150966 RepID=A0AAD3SGB4_NEPGR|nr:hypothetical protein Nepgr_012096 [Nepenthes gracilis]